MRRREGRDGGGSSAVSALPASTALRIPSVTVATAPPSSSSLYLVLLLIALSVDGCLAALPTETIDVYSRSSSSSSSKRSYTALATSSNFSPPLSLGPKLSKIPPLDDPTYDIGSGTLMTSSFALSMLGIASSKGADDGVVDFERDAE